MRRPERKLTPEEAALWARVANTVLPLEGKVPPRVAEGNHGNQKKAASRLVAAREAKPRNQATARHGLPPRSAEDHGRIPSERHGLDATWDRKLARGVVQPDFTLDLHGATLDAAHARLEHGIAQALAQGARVMLLITGRARVSDDHAGRGSRRGAIRAKFIDWLMAGPHASRIAAIRPAHPRHGGAGAVYLVLRKPR